MKGPLFAGWSLEEQGGGGGGCRGGGTLS